MGTTARGGDAAQAPFPRREGGGVTRGPSARGRSAGGGPPGGEKHRDPRRLWEAPTGLQGDAGRSPPGPAAREPGAAGLSADRAPDRDRPGAAGRGAGGGPRRINFPPRGPHRARRGGRGAAPWARERRGCPVRVGEAPALPPPAPPPRWARPPPAGPPPLRPQPAPGWGCAAPRSAAPRVTSGPGRAPPPHPPPPPRPGAPARPPPPPRPRAPARRRRCPGCPAGPGPAARRAAPGPSRAGSYLPACFRQPFPLRAPHPPPPRDRDPERAPRTAAAAGPATPPPPRTRPGPAPRPTHCARWAARLPLIVPATNRPAPGVSLLSGRSVLSARPIGWSPPNGMKGLVKNQRPLPTHSQESPPSGPKQSFPVVRVGKNCPVRTRPTPNISSRPRRGALIGRYYSVSQAVQTNQRGFPELGSGEGKPRPRA